MEDRTKAGKFPSHLRRSYSHLPDLGRMWWRSNSSILVSELHGDAAIRLCSRAEPLVLGKCIRLFPRMMHNASFGNGSIIRQGQNSCIIGLVDHDINIQNRAVFSR